MFITSSIHSFITHLTQKYSKISYSCANSMRFDKQSHALSMYNGL